MNDEACCSTLLQERHAVPVGGIFNLELRVFSPALISTMQKENPMSRFLTAMMCTLMIVVAWSATATMAQPPGEVEILGDANGDGVVTMADVTFVQAALENRTAQTTPFALTDVAHPCDGAIDGADLILIERAARAGRTSSPVISTCHGGPVGAPRPQPEPVPGLKTVDEIFSEISAEVPEFGGLYFDAQGQATIRLTDEEESVVEAANEAVFARFSEERLGTQGLRVVDADYGWDELHGYRQLALEVFEIPGVAQLDTDEVSNRVWIGLESWDDRAAVERLLQDLGIPLTAVTLEETGRTEPVQAAPFNDFTRPLVAALGMDLCTIGPVVNLGGVRGFFTNSHCTAIEGVVDHQEFHQPNNSTLVNWAALETIDPPFFTDATVPFCPSGDDCRWSDAVFATVGTTSRKGQVRVLDGLWGDVVPLTEVEMTPLAGELVVKAGKSSGLMNGKIGKTCMDDDYSFTRLCQGTILALALPGDSGSPVFGVGQQPLSSPEFVGQLYGMVWGRHTKLGTLYSPSINLFLDFGNFSAEASDDPPSVTISQPKDGAVIDVGNGNTILLAAGVGDLEDGFDCEGCSVMWTSSQDGFLGTSMVTAGQTSFQTELMWAGTHVITAAAFDTSGGSSSDTVTVSTSNVKPAVWIDEPLNQSTLPLGIGVTFSGSSFDLDAFGPLPCSSLEWIPFLPGDPGGFGCSVVLAFQTPGSRFMTLRAEDSNGGFDEDYILIHVDPLPPTGQPLVTWIDPEVNPLLARESVHALSAAAVDPDGASPLQFEWVLKGSDLIGAVNGEVTVGTATGGNGIKTSIPWLPSNHVIEVCGGIVLDLELRVTDAGNEQAVMTRQITVGGPLC